jgi:hypothetical protein
LYRSFLINQFSLTDTRCISAGVLHIRDHFIPGIDSQDHSFPSDWES